MALLHSPRSSARAFQLALPSLVLSLAAPTSLLSAQAPGPWVTALKDAGVGVEVQWRIRFDGSAWMMEIRNTGSTPIHFAWYLPGLESSDAAEGHGRVHLDSGAKATFTLAIAPGSLQLNQIRIGVEDDGAFWRP